MRAGGTSSRRPGSSSGRGPPSSSRWSASTSWATPSATRSTPGCAPSAGVPRHGIIGGQAIAPGEAPMTRITLLLAAGLLVWAAPIPAAADATLEANKKAVVEFYDAAINRKDFEAAAKFFGPRYVQHNPTAPDGIEGFKAFLGFLREKFPQSRSEIKRVWAEGDYVILHVHAVRTPGARGSAIVDVFKLENGKIVEHWDVIQEIPEKAANSNGVF